MQELYREIVSKNRVVAACLRSFGTEKKVAPNSGNSADDSSNVENNVTTKATKKENIGKSLEKRYHLLYLKAIEIQCLLENLLEKASVSAKFIFNCFICFFYHLSFNAFRALIMQV